MKRCPECGRDYNDDSLSFCLDDGSELLFGPGPVSTDEPATAIFHETTPPSDVRTQPQIHSTANAAVPDSTKSPGLNKRFLVVAIAIVTLAVAGLGGYWYFAGRGNRQISSIAVLPIYIQSVDADTDYLADGLAESLIFRLSQLPDLKVSPISSVRRYKGKETEPTQIAGELGVDAVMAGRLIKRGDNLNITVELVDARTKHLLWGEQYERKTSELLATQREIASTIVEKLQLKLSGKSQTGLNKRYTENSEAYLNYLQGRHHWNKRTKDAIEDGIRFFQKAIDLDPKFALAHVGIADSYLVMPSYAYLSTS